MSGLDLYDDRGVEIPVLIWCQQCRRYIAHETTHGCELTREQTLKRDTDRRLKVGLERTRRAA